MDFKSVFITNRLSPGDILMLTAAVRDLCTSYPELHVNVSTSAQELWNYNPHLDRSVTPTNADKYIKAEYPLIHTSNRGAHHFIHGFRKDLEKKLGVEIAQGPMCCDVFLCKSEADNSEWIKKETGLDHGYWLINAGCKSDFTAKLWDFGRFQEVVDRTRGKITWVQIGSKEHNHSALANVVDMRGKTNHRQLIQLMYRAGGVLTGVSYPMHLSTIPMFGEKDRRRPCVVIAGGREPSVWEAYTNHQFLHTCGMLQCCANGGCWHSRTYKLNDNDSKDQNLCKFTVMSEHGQVIPKCMDMITVDEVVTAIEKYFYYDINPTLVSCENAKVRVV